MFNGAVYKLAVVAVEYPDVKHNDKVKTADWEKALFSTKQYTGTSATITGNLNTATVVDLP